MTVEAIPVNQSGAGTLLLKAAPTAPNRVKVLGWLLNMASPGTYRFVDGSGADLTGNIGFTAGGAPQLVPWNFDSFVVQAAPGQSLSLVTVSGGGAQGVVWITIEPTRDVGARWIHVHKIDTEASIVVEACVNLEDVSRLHTYVPPASPDWKYDLGIRSEMHMRNGSMIFLQEEFHDLHTALSAIGVNHAS